MRQLLPIKSVVLEKLARVKADVGPARRKVIDVILERPAEVIHLSITELAELSKTSEATIVRLFQELGYKGYQDFKINLSQTLIPLEQAFHKDISAEDPPMAILSSIFRVSVETLTDTEQVIDASALEQAVDLLANAQRIEFIGLGGSGVVALDAYHKFIRLGIPVNASQDGHNAAQLCSVLRPGDVVVAVSHSGSTSDILEAVQLARASGAKIVAITRYGRSPLHSLADAALCTLSPETEQRSEAIASRIAQLAIIDTLLVAVFLRRQPDAGELVKRAREALASKRL